MNPQELLLLLTAKDTASAVLRGFVGGALSAVVGGLADAARAAATDEANTRKLAAAVDASGSSFSDYQGQIADVIKRGQDLAFSDEATRDSLSSLVQATGSVQDAMKLNTLAMDLARGKSIDLGTASQIVGKVAEGNTAILSRYGIQLKAGTTAQEALAILQKRFANEAKTYGESTQGFLDRVKDGLTEFSEAVGYALGPAQGLIALLPGMSAGFSAAASAVAFFSNAQNIARLRTLAMQALMAPVRLATLAWAGAQAVLNAVMSLNPIALVVLAILGLIAILKIVYDHSEAFRSIVQAVWTWLQNLLKPLSWVADAVGALAHAFGLGSKDVQGASADAGKAISGLATGGSSDLSSFQSSASGSLGKVRTQLQAMTYDVEGLIGRFNDLRVAQSGINAIPQGGGGGTLTGYAEGGVVPGPIGMPQLAIVHGGEQVLTPAQQAAGGGVTLVFNAPIYGMDDFKRQVAAAVRDTRLVGGLRGVAI